MPEIKNLEEFKGEVWHSRDYREPDPFLGKKVIILGGGPSAVDISLEVKQFTPSLIVSCKAENQYLHGYIKWTDPVVSAKRNSFLTSTGEEVECEAIIFCTGYQYDFPFLSPSCGVSVEKGKYIYPLYRHKINAKIPSMAFIGIPFSVCPFPQFNIQVRYFLKCLKGEIELPSEEGMIHEIKEEEETRCQQSIPLNHSHKFGVKQWEYNRKLAEKAGFSNLIKPVIQKAYQRAGERRADNPYKYKNV